MSNEKLYIPKKCKVGFNVRTDTYTGMLGYIIYHDGKVWRKEGSWESWREKHTEKEEFEKLKRKSFDDRVKQTKEQFANSYYRKYVESGLDAYLKIAQCDDYSKYQYYDQGKRTNNPKLIPVEFENVPTDGFVLNKDVGGVRHSWSHNGRMEKIRIYDPRGFEFEITVPNLLFILQECSSVKGKGLEGEFIYAWEGKDLVLLPVGCEDYKKSAGFTKLQEGKVSAKELVLGISYKDNNQDDFIYMGRFDTYHSVTDKTNKTGRYSYGQITKHAKHHIFYAETGYQKGSFLSFSSLTKFKSKNSDIVVSNFADLTDKLQNKSFISKPKSFEFEPITEKDLKTPYDGATYLSEHFYTVGNGIQQCSVYIDGKNYSYYPNHKIEITNGVIKKTPIEYNNRFTEKKYAKDDITKLFFRVNVRLENGKKYKLD